MKKRITRTGSAGIHFQRCTPRRGSFLIEGTLALSLIVAISLILLDTSINVLKPRIYTIHQNMTDAQISYEVAYANRADFDSLSESSSEWPLYPATKDSTVTIGTLPGGQDITAVVKRFRKNLTRTTYGAQPVLGLSDLGIEVWELQSVLVYQIGGKEYVKACTVIRSQ